MSAQCKTFCVTSLLIIVSLAFCWGCASETPVLPPVAPVEETHQAAAAQTDVSQGQSGETAAEKTAETVVVVTESTTSDVTSQAAQQLSDIHFTQVFPDGIAADGDAPEVHWLDYDRDGKADLWLAGRLYHNVSVVGDFRFEDVTDACGIKDMGVSLCYDYDNDGWCDIVVIGETPHVWRNRRDGTFEDKAQELGFTPGERPMTLCAGDVDGDGRPDLFIGKGEDWQEREHGSTYYPAELWLNQGEKWVECAAQKGVDRKTYVRAVLMADINGDGRSDIFVANYRLQPNLLWLTNAKGGFVESGVSAGVAGKNEPDKYYDKIMLRNFGPSFGHSIGACWTDYDNDGRIDIFVSNLAHKYVGNSPRGHSYDFRGYVCGDSEMLHNLGNGRFADGRAQMRVPCKPIGARGVFRGDELWAGCAPADVDNDGWEDVFVPQIYDLPYASTLLFMNQDGRRYSNRAQLAGIVRFDTYSGAWADIDGDGALDLLTGGRPANKQAPQKAFYRNDGKSGNWLKVRLSSGDAGTAIGAVVTIKPDVGAPQMRVFSTATSTLSQQNEPVLHFGLGLAVRATVTVKWLDGTTATVDAGAGDVVEFFRGKIAEPPAPAEAAPAEAPAPEAPAPEAPAPEAPAPEAPAPEAPAPEAPAPETPAPEAPAEAAPAPAEEKPAE